MAKRIHKQYGKRGFLRLFCHIFRKKPFLRASKGKINAKSPADAEDPPGGLFAASRFRLLTRMTGGSAG